MEAVKAMPIRVQELLGYKSHFALGVVDVGSPMALLERRLENLRAEKNSNLELHNVKEKLRKDD